MERVRTLRTDGFTLLELLIVVAIIGILAAMLAPAVMGALEFADRVTCASNLRQLGFATQHYLGDHDGYFFPIRSAGDPHQWYFGLEEDAYGDAPEGERVLDKTKAVLYPYAHNYDTIEICPAFSTYGVHKPKYKGAWWTYGVNKILSPDNARP
jgi:prepilin-type N-terminal cleavage/methylation domain-containing protein